MSYDHDTSAEQTDLKNKSHLDDTYTHESNQHIYNIMYYYVTSLAI